MFAYTFMQNALMISFLIAVLCPCIGIFLVLRRHSMIGDTLAHSSLAGVAIGLATGRNPIFGAFIFTALSGALIEFLRAFFSHMTELILTVVLALSVGVAITIISSGGLSANANSYLFGSILTVTRTDLILVAALSFLSVLTLIALYHQLIFIAYDEEAARIAGVRVRLINYAFSILVASAIAVSIRIVGVLVLSSMIALPVATALQLRRGFRQTLLFSILFSIIDIMLGLILSYRLNVAPGGLTALISVILLLTVLMARQIINQIRTRRARSQTQNRANGGESS